MRKLLAILLLCWCAWVSAQNYRVGDVYTAPDGSRGIVYYLHPDGSGGWVVALTDASAGCAWGTANDVPGLTNQNPSYYLQLLNDTSGYANTQAIRFYQNNSTTYAAGKVDFAHGWVLPSPAQLSMLYGQLPLMASAITGAGGTSLAYTNYWCSAENSASNAWCVEFGTNYWSGYFNYVAKTTNCRVRAVRSFSNTAVVYDTSLTYLWNTGSTQPYINVSPTQTTTYTVTGTTDYGCSNTAEQTIIVGTGSAQTIYDTICRGEGYEANGFSLTAAQTNTMGIITRSRTITASGCSSTLTLRLLVRAKNSTNITRVACGSYTWNGVTYYASGSYTQTFTNINGCDSVVTLNLTIHNPTHTATTITHCDSYTWHNVTYTSSGTYIYSFSDAYGCTQVDTLHLTIRYSTHNVETVDTCDSYTWHGVTYTASGTYMYDYTNESACPSTDTLHLTIRNSMHNTVTVTACESYIWNDSTYTESGSYTQTFTATNGCDSVVTLQLTIISLPELSHTPDTTIIAGTSVNLWASGADVLSWTDSDGNVLASGSSLTVNPTIPATYYITGQNYGAATSNNLVANGDFEQGNVGFTSDYTYVAGYNSMYFGRYAITTDGLLIWGEDHLYGYAETGQFMLVDGSESPYAVVWQQTVFVSPNTYYAFSAQVASTLASYTADSWALLQFSVNGTQLGSLFHSPDVLNVWRPYYEVWYSGDNTSATLTILNQNNSGIGNDFGLDNIVFAPLAECSATDSVFVSVIYNVTDERTICESELPYVWNGVTFEHADTLEVVLQATNGADSVVVMHLTVLHGTHNMLDTTVCDSYQWHGQTLDASGTYTYDYTNADGCASTDTLHLTILESPDATITTTTDTICVGAGVTLEAEVLNFDTFVTPPAPPAVAVGDILCSDGSTVKPSAYAASGRTAIGVVLYVNDSGHGWAVNLHEDGEYVWSTTISGNIPGAIIHDSALEAIADYNGSYNTYAIRSVSNTSLYPAAMAVDYANGWYLPASGQLYLMYPLMPILNESLALCGGTPFNLNSSWYYCSSSVASARNMWSLDHNGYIIHYLPTLPYRVRSMRNF